MKTLAQETSGATEQISEQVQTVQREIRNSVTAIKSIEGKIGNVNDSTAAIASAIEEQNATTKEISHNTQISATNVEELNGNVTNVGEAAKNTGEAASEVLGASDELSQQITKLNDNISTFLEKVRDID